MSTKFNGGYGTLPNTTTTTTTTTTGQSSSPTSDLSFIARAKQTTQSVIATRRPLRELFQLSSFSLPPSYDVAMNRVRWNISYFRVNYAMAMLLIVFLSLLWHPVSMIVFLIVFVAWFFLYLFRDGPVVVYGRILDDRTVLCGLSLVTVIALVFTHVGLNVLVSLIVGVVVIGLHAAFRGTEDLYLDEESNAEGGLLSVVGSQPLRSSYAPI